MTRFPFRLAIAAVALAALSCANPQKLSLKSGELLAAGRAQEAYENARAALRKDPAYEPARAAMIAAAAQLRRGNAATMDSLALLGDSVGAADMALRWEAFTRQLTQFRTSLGPDSALARRQDRVRLAAAGAYYDRAEQSLKDARPKDAYQGFRRTESYWPDFRDVAARINESYEDALVTVAVLPFANQTDVAGLSRSLDEVFFGRIEDHATPGNLKFTRLLDRDEVMRTVTLSELDEMSREEAVRIGKKLHVDQVLWGRYHSLRSTDQLRDDHFPVYRKVVEHGSKDGPTERYLEYPMELIERERHVTVHYEMELVDTRSRAVLSRQASLEQASAAIAFTRFDPVGDCDDYCLITPGARQADHTETGKIETRWKARMGDWDLPEFLKRAHDQQRRSHYERAYLPEFGPGWDGRPIFLGELPPAEDLAQLALEDTWKSALKMLEELDRK